jgi:hypothetical protein
LCAALDRQHPRDLFDVRILFANEGIGPKLKDAFLVYLLGHNRPMAELLDPAPQDMRPLYESEFKDMALEPTSLEELQAARERLIGEIKQSLTAEDKEVLSIGV